MTNSNLARETKIKKLIYRSQNRGTKETDVILGKFATKFLYQFDDHELDLFEQILQENDVDLFNIITGKQEIPDHINNSIMKKILNFKPYE